MGISAISETPQSNTVFQHCTLDQWHRARKLEEMLGHWLPFCAQVKPTTDGYLIAYQTNKFGHMVVPPLFIEFSETGDVMFSERSTGKLSNIYLSFDRLKFSRIDPKKFREVRALLLFAEDLKKLSPELKKRYGIRD